jgi:hypothetical protein
MIAHSDGQNNGSEVRMTSLPSSHIGIADWDLRGFFLLIVTNNQQLFLRAAHSLPLIQFFLPALGLLAPWVCLCLLHPAIEALNLSSRVNDALLARVERMTAAA